MELINSVNIDALYALASKLIVLVGVMAFLVSVVTQVLKQIPGLEKRVPTQITVIVTSMILCPAAMAAMAVYYSVPIDWFMVFQYLYGCRESILQEEQVLRRGGSEDHRILCGHRMYNLHRYPYKSNLLKT